MVNIQFFISTLVPSFFVHRFFTFNSVWSNSAFQLSFMSKFTKSSITEVLFCRVSMIHSLMLMVLANTVGVNWSFLQLRYPQLAAPR